LKRNIKFKVKIKKKKERKKKQEQHIMSLPLRPSHMDKKGCIAALLTCNQAEEEGQTEQ